jgi:hypothetical protein
MISSQWHVAISYFAMILVEISFLLTISGRHEISGNATLIQFNNTHSSFILHCISSQTDHKRVLSDTSSWHPPQALCMQSKWGKNQQKSVTDDDFSSHTCKSTQSFSDLEMNTTKRCSMKRREHTTKIQTWFLKQISYHWWNKTGRVFAYSAKNFHFTNRAMLQMSDLMKQFKQRQE